MRLLAAFGIFAQLVVLALVIAHAAGVIAW